jgi:transcriptional regulator with XRE-family HTH domain
MIEHEENSPTVETIERLCKALDADPALLFRRSKT